jgi:hypothetical protein
MDHGVDPPAERRGWRSSMVRTVPRENSTAMAPTKMTNTKVPAKDAPLVKTSLPPPAADSALIVVPWPKPGRFAAGSADARTTAAVPIENRTVATVAITRTPRGPCRRGRDVRSCRR